ncbi:MAG TPA: hypothetical protein VF102_01745 [Gemmatimonadaceae bacterium]|jgi:hypothetical protein
MVKRPYGPADTSAQAVTRRLRATGSSDPDVLYAAREELAAPFQRHRTVCVLIIIAGTLVCLTIVLAPVGVAAVVFGVRHRRRSERNLATIDAAHTQFITALAPLAVDGARSARATASAIPERPQPNARAGTER